MYGKKIHMSNFKRKKGACRRTYTDILSVEWEVYKMTCSCGKCYIGQTKNSICTILKGNPLGNPPLPQNTNTLIGHKIFHFNNTTVLQNNFNYINIINKRIIRNS